MLLRRFSILNDLPIAAIQAQSDVKLAIQVSITASFLTMYWLMKIQSGVAREMIRRDETLGLNSQKMVQRDLLTRLCKSHSLPLLYLVLTSLVRAFSEQKISEAELLDHV
jgi:hypothetical protein